MKFLFLMDPLETVSIEKDTSFILMIGAHSRGHTVYYLSKGGIFRKNGKNYFNVTEVVPQKIKENAFIIKDKITLSEDEIDVVFIRTDPPFDSNYLMHTWLLDLLPNRVKVVNSPTGIRTVNEKVWATQFASIIPNTLICSDKTEMLNFISDNKKIIAKPTDGFGGKSIFLLDENDSNLNVALETLSNDFTTEIILQEYINDSNAGDKRILLLNGEPIGALLRVHSTSDHRNNIFAGGSVEEVDITDNDKKIIEILKPELKKLGLYFVGIDIIGDYLIEVNVTSPTCLQEMNRFYNKQLENEVIEFVENLKLEKSCKN